MRSVFGGRPPLFPETPGWRNQEHAYDFRAMQAEIKNLKEENERWEHSLKDLVKKCRNNGFSSPQAAINYSLNCELRINDIERELRQIVEAINSDRSVSQLKAAACQASNTLNDVSWKTRPVESKWVEGSIEKNGS